MMIIIVILGAFIDWLGIILICFPVFLPLAQQLRFDQLWIVALIAVVLQTSFLTPPFGYALFFLSGIAPSGINLGQIYRGIIPYVIAMLIDTTICIIFPQTILWLRSLVVK